MSGTRAKSKRARGENAECDDLAVVNDPAEWAARRDAKLSTQPEPGYFAFYSSATNAITTNVSLMHIPIDDHAIVRGHAVFDTCSLTEGRLYRLQIHLDRLFSSASKARLPLPWGEDEATNRAAIVSIVKATARASGQKNADIRFWLTAGSGNLGVTPTGCAPGFYVLTFGGLPGITSGGPTDGIPEVSVPHKIVGLKPPMLAEIKSNNYMLNALTMMAARDRGGTFGIGVDGDDFILESCVLNVVVIGNDQILRTPPFKQLLNGTTVRRVMELAMEHLVPRGLIRGVRQDRRISLIECYHATELFLCAGDTHTYACTTLDSHPIGEARPGPVHTAIKELLHADACAGRPEDHERLD